MRALTLTQPWAGLVASGIKLVENRPRNMAPRDLIGQRFAIHASRQIDSDVYVRIKEIAEQLARALLLSVVDAFTLDNNNEIWVAPMGSMVA